MAQPETKRAKATASNDGWSPSSWRSFAIKHQPIYDDKTAVKAVCDDIAKLPSIVQPSEVEALKV